MAPIAPVLRYQTNLFVGFLLCNSELTQEIRDRNLEQLPSETIKLIELDLSMDFYRYRLYRYSSHHHCVLHTVSMRFNYSLQEILLCSGHTVPLSATNSSVDWNSVEQCLL